MLLEPIVHLEVTVPNEKVGDIQGDLASRRGRPEGQTMLPGNMSVTKSCVNARGSAHFLMRKRVLQRVVYVIHNHGLAGIDIRLFK